MSLRTAYSLFSFDETTDPVWGMERIAAAGFDGVELVMGSQGALTTQTSEAGLVKLRSAAEGLGLHIHSVGGGAIWNNNLVGDDPVVRRRGFSILESQLRAAAVVGADKTLMVPGYVGCDFIKDAQPVAYDVAWDRALESLSRLGEIARSVNVKIGIENVWNKFLLSPLEMKSFIDQIGNPMVGVYFDTGNVIYNGYPHDWIRILNKRIVGIHLSDFRLSQAGLGGFVDLFAGDVDFIAVANALREVGYDDYLTVEMLPNYQQFPELSCRTSKPAVDKVVSLIASSG